MEGVFNDGGAARAATMTVGNPGSGLPNYATIQAAVDAATPATVIAVASGAYVENVRISKDMNHAEGVPGLPIVLRFLPGASVTSALRPGDADWFGCYTLVINKRNYWRIEQPYVRSGQQAALAIIGNITTPCLGIEIIEPNVLCEQEINPSTGNPRGEDGIKVVQATGIIIQGGRVEGGNDQSIDFFGTVNGRIDGVTIPYSGTQCGVVFKAGSTDNILINSAINAPNGQGVRDGDAVQDNTPYPTVNVGMQGETARNQIVANTITSKGYAIVASGALDGSETGNTLSSQTSDGNVIYLRDSLKDDNTSRWNTLRYAAARVAGVLVKAGSSRA